MNFEEYLKDSIWATDQGVSIMQERTAHRIAESTGVAYSSKLCSTRQAREIARMKAYAKWQKFFGVR